MVILRALVRSLVYRAPFECVRCPACASARLYELDLLMLRRPLEGRRFGFVSGCEECGLVFSNPRPSDAELARMYSPGGDWVAPRAGDATGVYAPKGKSWARVFEPIADVLRVTAPNAGAAVLDFGCGAGTLLDALQDCGWSTSGIEPATELAFQRHRRLEAVPDRPAFDLIVANHVLEHVADPLGLLRQFAAAARDGAFLLVSVPRLDTLPLHRDYKYVINGHAHVTAFTWPCLQTLLARAGWQPVAEPPDEIGKGGGRRTRARLRVLARRLEHPRAGVRAPAAAARTAIRDYYAASGRAYRAGLGLRFAARHREAERRQAVRAAKAHRAAASGRNAVKAFRKTGEERRQGVPEDRGQA